MLEKISLIPLLTAFILMLPGFRLVAGPVVPVNLQCEYRVNPAGIDQVRPRLFWQAESKERDQMQTAYEILVAASPELLRHDQGDLWDSGKISSDESINITYAGKPMASGTQCFWKVRIWDKLGRASDWSTPARWSMGLLEPSDWQGKWIGLDQGGTTNSLDGATWIWFPERNPAESAPLGTRYFRRTLELPAGHPVTAATIIMTADNEFNLFVNGHTAGGSDNWKAPGKLAIGSWLKPGKNVLAVEARNVGEGATPAGLIARLKVDFAAGNSLVLDTDGNWKSAKNLQAGWNTTAFDDTVWGQAKPLGAYGIQPWGTSGDDGRPLAARYLRREFSVEKKVKRATAYVCGLGLFELYVNGRKISDDVLSPALSEYNKRAFYLTFDVTDQLESGVNALGVILGNGRYFAPRQRVPAECLSFGYPKLLLQLNLEYTDGTTGTSSAMKLGN